MERVGGLGQSTKEDFRGAMVLGERSSNPTGIESKSRGSSRWARRCYEPPSWLGEAAVEHNYEPTAEIRRIMRDLSPPREQLHGDPTQFLKKKQDPKHKLYGDLGRRVQSARETKPKSSAKWRPSHNAPVFRQTAIRQPSELPKRQTLFYRMWALGHFSFVRVKFSGARDGLNWTIPIRHLAADQLLPVFMDGLREPSEPTRYFAIQGTTDLIYGATRAQLREAAYDCGKPLKDALDTREAVTTAIALTALRTMIKKEPAVVEELLPFLPLFASPLALFRGTTLEVNAGYDRHKTVGLQELIDNVLHSFCEYGGRAASAVLSKHLPGWRQVTGTEAPAVRSGRAETQRTLGRTMPYTAV